MRRVAAVLTFLMMVALPQVGSAEDFYRGKTLKIISGTSAGSGTDVYARILQQFVSRHIPGNPTVVVQNMPAGGGLAAINHIFNVAAKDGTEIGLFNRSTVFSHLLGDSNAKFEPEKFNWIGTPASFADDAWVFMINAGLPYGTFADLLRAGAPINVGKGSTTNPFIQIIETQFGVKMKGVNGYQNQELALAFERREIDAIGNAYQSVVSTMPDLLKRNLARIVIQFGHAKRLDALKDIPTAQELAKDADQLALIKLAEISLTLGFPIAAPPEAPPANVAILRKAFEETMRDPAYKAESEKQMLAYSPKFGDELQGDLISLANTPAPIVAGYRQLFNQ